MCWCEYAMDVIVLISMSSRQKGLSFVLAAYRTRGRFPQLAVGSPLNSMHRVQCLKKWSSAPDIAAIHIVTPYRTKPITAPNFHRALPVAPRLCAVKKRASLSSPAPPASQLHFPPSPRPRPTSFGNSPPTWLPEYHSKPSPGWP